MSLATRGVRRLSLLARLGWYRVLSIAGHDDYVRFIVLTRSRTGSNLLISFLNGHPDIFAEGEIFARMNERDPLARLAAAFGRQPRHIKAKGFKIFYYHPLDADGTALWQRLAGMQGLRVIHLTRRNVLRTLLSRKIAGLQDAWTATRYDRSAVEARRVRFTPEELEQGFQETRRWEESVDRRFPAQATLHLSYEELIADPAAVYAAMLAFLGAREVAPSTHLRRQNPEKLRELIDNYSELKEAFAGSPWQAYFDE